MKIRSLLVIFTLVALTLIAANVALNDDVSRVNLVSEAVLVKSDFATTPNMRVEEAFKALEQQRTLAAQ